MANIDIKVSPQNLIEWSHMEDWVNGASSAPTQHTLSGSGASIAREATTIKIGTYSAAVTRGGADATLYHDYPDYADYAGRKVTFGCWVYATVASRAGITISDGVGSESVVYHTGGSSWEFLEVTRNVDSSATRIRVEMQVNTGDTTAYFDSGILCQGSSTYTILTDIADIGKFRTTSKYISQDYTVPRREGSKNANFRIDSKSLSSDAMVIGATPTAQRTNFDSLMTAINSVRNKPNGDAEEKNLYLFDDRYYKGFFDQVNTDPEAATRINNVKLRFSMPDPFLYAVNKTRVNQSLSGTTTFTVTNGGTAIARPVITVTNNSSNITSLTIENLTTGQKISYVGTLVTGTDLVIDTDNLTVENNGTGDLANVTNEIGIILFPGGNEIKVTGIVSGDIDVDWFERWY